MDIKQQAKVLINELYDINAVGSGLHIVLDDWNLEDDSIKFCIENLDKYCHSEEEKRLCKEIGELLLQMTEEERERVVID